MASIKDVLHAEAESKKEEAKYDSDETVSAEELDLNVSNSLEQIDPSNRSSETILKISGYSKVQEVISISSDSEQENAEQKIEKALLWKSRPPKKCSKYIPEEVPVRFLLKAFMQTLLNPLLKTCRLWNHVFIREAMNIPLGLCHLVRTICQNI